MNWLTVSTSWLLRSKWDQRLQLVAFAVTFVVIIVGILLWDTLTTLSTGVTYPGIFVHSLVGSGAIFVPIPSIASVCAGGWLLDLNPLVVALVAASGEVLGELVGYVVGFGGGMFISRWKIFQPMRNWMRSRGAIALFIFALIPNPLFDILGLMAGGLRYPLYRFLVIVWVGKVLKNLAVGYACIYGIEIVINSL